MLDHPKPNWKMVRTLSPLGITVASLTAIVCWQHQYWILLAVNTFFGGTYFGLLLCSIAMERWETEL